VPIRLLDILDEGKNPQLFTKELLEDTRNRNKEVLATQNNKIIGKIVNSAQREDRAVQEVPIPFDSRVEAGDAQRRGRVLTGSED
jgi:hypothetical protein